MKKAHKLFIISLLGLGVCSNQVQANHLTFSAMALKEAGPLQTKLANTQFKDLIKDPNLLKRTIETFRSNLLVCFSRISPDEKKQYKSLQTALQNANGLNDLKQLFKLLPAEVSKAIESNAKDPVIRNFLGL